MSKEIAMESIATRILELKGKKVMLDRDLAKLYGVAAKVLNQAVKRNIRRFPENFMFQLSWEEAESLRSQFVTLNKTNLGRTRRGKHIKYLPYAFTEHGMAMLSNVLNNERAIQVNILIMRAFTKLREIPLNHKDLSVRIETVEKKYDKHDQTIKKYFWQIKQLLGPPPLKPKPPIGFRVYDALEKG
jgi:phage regulator Rha-like protein